MEGSDRLVRMMFGGVMNKKWVFALLFVIILGGTGSEVFGGERTYTFEQRYPRTLTVGGVPASGDESLVLRKGTHIPVRISTDTNTELVRFQSTAVQFFSPPINLFKYIVYHKSGGKDERLASEDIPALLRQYDDAFKSPVLSAEWIIGVESKDWAAENSEVTLFENASGDLEVLIGGLYKFDLYLHKDLVFSAPFDDSNLLPFEK